MNSKEYNELQVLHGKIRGNTATSGDYSRYEDILARNGISHEQFVRILRQNGFSSLEQYYTQRQVAQTPEQRFVVEGAVLGAILGIGGALLLYWGLKQMSATTSGNS